MIPTIETICEDLKAGKITVQQAIGWLHQHAEGSANELRDHFAAMALQGMLCSMANPECYAAALNKARKAEILLHEGLAISAYAHADALLKERDTPSATERRPS